jgi:hypothetical protein
MPQTTNAVAMACGQLEISIDGCNVWTDISGSSSSVTGTTQTRINDQNYTLDGDFAIIRGGKKEPLELVFSIVYTPTAAEAFSIAQQIFEETGCGGNICIRWSPNGGNAGDQRFTTADGILISFDYPTMDATAGGPIMTSFTSKHASVTAAIITT